MCKANICRLWECVWSGIYCVYLVRGVRQISWCVTGAIKVVALDTAHEQHNDSGFMLISPCLAPSWAAGQFSCQAQPKLRWRIEQDSATALRLLAQVGEKARAGGKKEKPEQGRSWILSSRSLFFVVFFHPLLFSFLSYAFLSFIYRCCRFSFLFFEIVLDFKKKENDLAQSKGEHKNMEKKRVKERVQLLFSARGEVRVLKSTCCLFYCPLGGERNTTFVLNTRKQMACTLFVDDIQLFERSLQVKDLFLTVTLVFWCICLPPSWPLPLTITFAIAVCIIYLQLILQLPYSVSPLFIILINYSMMRASDMVP